MKEGVDTISSMPDEILHHILSFIPIEYAIRTSALSRRWRHVWCDTPCIDFGGYMPRKRTDRDMDQTLTSYRALKITSFHLVLNLDQCVPDSQVDSWLEFAMSRNVENLSFFCSCVVDHTTYRFPDFFYRSSSLESLNLDFVTIPPAGCTVSWKSLRSLTLDYCFQPLDDIISGCPVLETLTLRYCGGLDRLDLSKSPTLTTLIITRDKILPHTPRLLEIVAPHLLNLDLSNADEPCTLVDVSSLTRARIGICMYDDELYPFYIDVKPDFLQLQNMLLNMLPKLRNVEQLTFDATFLQIISLAELRGVPFPTLKVRTLTLETIFARSFIPGIARLLQNSPGLKTLIVHATEPICIEDMDLDKYLDSQGLNLDQCWRSKCDGFPTSSDFRFKDATWYLKLVASCIEWLLKNVETLETLVVVFKYVRCSNDATWFEKLLQMLPMLSNNNNVSIVLRRR